MSSWKNQAKALAEVYSNDLNNDLLIELKHFVPQVKLQERGFSSNCSNEDDRSMILQFVRSEY